MLGRYRPTQAKTRLKKNMSFLNRLFDGSWNRERAFWRFEGNTSPKYDFSEHK
jgi:hypothetical protein